MSLSQSLFDPVASWGHYGVALAMTAVFLPALTAAFWASACLLRSLAHMLRH